MSRPHESLSREVYGSPRCIQNKLQQIRIQLPKRAHNQMLGGIA